MDTSKFVNSLKKVDWIGVGVTAVGVLGIVLSGKQKDQEKKLLDKTIEEKVTEAVNNLK